MILSAGEGMGFFLLYLYMLNGRASLWQMNSVLYEE